MKSNNQCTAFLNLEANYISWVRNAINLFSGSSSIFLSAIILTQSTYPTEIQDILAFGLIVAGLIGLGLSASWLLWSTLEFRQRQKAFFAQNLDFTKERGYLWKYINAVIFFLLLVFLIVFIFTIVIKIL